MHSPAALHTQSSGAPCTVQRSTVQRRGSAACLTRGHGVRQPLDHRRRDPARTRAGGAHPHRHTGGGSARSGRAGAGFESGPAAAGARLRRAGSQLWRPAGSPTSRQLGELMYWTCVEAAADTGPKARSVLWGLTERHSHAKQRRAAAWSPSLSRRSATQDGLGSISLCQWSTTPTLSPSTLSAACNRVRT